MVISKHKSQNRLRKLTVRVCMGTGGLAAGSQDVYNAFRRELRMRGISAELAKKCVKKTGCHSLCSRDVLVDIVADEEVTTYAHVTPERAKRIVNEHIINGKPVTEWLAGPEYHAFHKSETKLLLEHIGKIDPEDIEDYIAVGGYRAVRKALSKRPSELLHVIKRSRLRGRGGAGFPTGLKWEVCRNARTRTKYLICNADEGDPGAFMDCAIIEGNPHALIEGMIIASYTIGVHKAYVYIRAEYPVALHRLKIALKQARKKGFLGKNMFNGRYSLEIRIKEGAGAFVCGEETALIASVEGRRGMPRSKPPFPAVRGLWGMPTVINNVETLATIPLIINRGADWFASIGTEKSKGTKMFSITGKVNNTGLIEVPMGITLREIVYDIGGGCPHGHSLKAVQTGGPSGGCIPASLIEMPLDYESLRGVGSMMGSGGMIVMDSTTCMVDMAKFFLEFTQNESCGKCLPCRVGNKRLYERLKLITEGRGVKGDIEFLQSLAEDIKISSLCGLGQTAPNPVLSTIRYFREEYEAHIMEKKCPAGVCEALRQYTVNADVCKMCGKCFNECPAEAISWQKKQPAVIDKEICIQCGRCYEVCPFNAIM